MVLLWIYSVFLTLLRASVETLGREDDHLMKHILFGILFLAISCSGDQTQLRDTTKFSYLAIGTYTLGIDKRFDLIGTLEKDSKKENFDNVKSSRIYTREYIFADLSNGIDNIYRGVIVYDNQLKDPQTFWSKEISYENTKVGGKIDSGYVNVGEVKMAYMILRAKPAIDQNIMKLLTNKESKVGKILQEPDQVSMVYFSRLIGRSRNVVIVYVDGMQNAEIAFNESLQYLTLDN